jgi:TonB-linked SusC/RagA family outer membrane protein
LAVGSRSTIDLVMVQDILQLEELVVVGYGTQQKVNVVGSIATTKGDDIANIPTANVGNTFVGRLPGVVAVNRSGEPGKDGSEIRIRGWSNALIIVDGVEQNFTQIDPNEIESVSVLKDASGSIYGARAGNGVILITTKRGREGKPQFSFTGNHSFQAPIRRHEMVNSAEYAELWNEGLAANGLAPLYTQEQIEKYRSGTDPNYPNTDWWDAAFRTWSPMSQYNLNTSGGSQAVKYFFSLGYLDQMGMMRSNDTWFNRYNYRSNIDAQINKDFSVSFDLNGRFEKTHTPFHEGGEFERIMESLFGSSPMYPGSFSDPTKNTYNGKRHSVVAASEADVVGYRNDDRNFQMMNLALNYNLPFIQGLSTRVVFNYNNSVRKRKSLSRDFEYHTYDQNTDTYIVMGRHGSKTLSKSNEFNQGFNVQASVSYKNSFNAQHNLEGMLLFEGTSSSGDFISAYREGYLSMAVEELFAGGHLNRNNDGYAWNDGRMSYLGRLKYDYSSKYIFESTFRYDASPRFHEDVRWGFFPSFMAGWNISEESFLRDNNAIDQIKLRVSIGRSGYDAISNFNYLTGYRLAESYAFGTSQTLQQGFRSRGLSNIDTSWEEMMIQNIGVDFSLFRNKLYGEIDAFYRKREGMLARRTMALPTTFGATLPFENLNSQSSRGIELMLGHSGRTNHWRYTFEGNVSWNRAKWIHFDEPVYSTDEERARLQQSGNWVNRTFGYVAMGLFQSDEEIKNWTFDQDGQGNKTIRPGDIKYMDLNGDGKLTQEDAKEIGRGGFPEIIFGSNINVAYKGFSVMMLWQGATNFNKMFSDESMVPFSNGNTPLKIMMDRWTPDNPDARFPRTVFNGSPNNRHVSTFWMQDATYLRLKNIQVSYDLGKVVGNGNLRVYFSGMNLLTLTKVWPYDPEAPETGIGSRGWYYPQQKTVSLGINLNF